VKDAVRAAIIFIVQNIFFALARDTTSLLAEGPFLVIAPHPDDETLGCGCFIVRARALRQKVCIVIVTDGRTWPVSSSMTPDDVANMRRGETERAAAVLGVDVKDVVFLNLPEMEVEAHAGAIEESLRQHIEHIHPRLILSPYGIDQHPDHRAVARAVDQLCKKGVITCPVFEYPIWFWLRAGLGHLMNPAHLRCLRRISARGYSGIKKTAMQAHRSQCPHLVGEDYSQSFFQPFSFAVQYLSRYEFFFEKNIS